MAMIVKRIKTDEKIEKYTELTKTHNPEKLLEEIIKANKKTLEYLAER